MYLNAEGKKKLQVQYWLISATLHKFNHLGMADAAFAQKYRP
jgi:hypothetical protein